MQQQQSNSFVPPVLNLRDSQESSVLPKIEFQDSVGINPGRSDGTIKVKVDLKGKLAYQRKKIGKPIQGIKSYAVGKKQYGNLMQEGDKGQIFSTKGSAAMNNNELSVYQDNPSHLSVSGKNLVMMKQNTGSLQNIFEKPQTSSALGNALTDLNITNAESTENVLERSAMLNESSPIDNGNSFRNSRNLTNIGSAAQIFKTYQQTAYTHNFNQNNWHLKPITSTGQAMLQGRISKSSAQNHRSSNRQIPPSTIKQIKQKIEAYEPLAVERARSGANLSQQDHPRKSRNAPLMLQAQTQSVGQEGSFAGLHKGSLHDSVELGAAARGKLIPIRKTEKKKVYRLQQGNENAQQRLDLQPSLFLQKYGHQNSAESLLNQPALNMRNKFNKLTQSTAKCSRSTSKLHQEVYEQYYSALGGQSNASSYLRQRRDLFNKPEPQNQGTAQTLTLSNRYTKKFIGASASALRARAQNPDYAQQNYNSINNLMDAYRSQLSNSYQENQKSNQFVFDETNMSHCLDKNRAFQFDEINQVPNQHGRIVIGQLEKDPPQTKPSKRILRNDSSKESKGRLSPTKVFLDRNDPRKMKVPETPELGGDQISNGQSLPMTTILSKENNNPSSSTDQLKGSRKHLPQTFQSIKTQDAVRPNEGQLATFSSIDKDIPFDQLAVIGDVQQQFRRNSGAVKNSPFKMQDIDHIQSKNDTGPDAVYDDKTNQIDLKTVKKASAAAKAIVSGIDTPFFDKHGEKPGLSIEKMRSSYNIQVENMSGDRSPDISQKSEQNKKMSKFNKNRTQSNIRPKNATILATLKYQQRKNKQKQQKTAAHEYQYADSKQNSIQKMGNTGNMTNRQNNTRSKMYSQSQDSKGGHSLKSSLGKKNSMPIFSMQSSIERNTNGDDDDDEGQDVAIFDQKRMDSSFKNYADSTSLMTKDLNDEFRMMLAVFGTQSANGLQDSGFTHQEIEAFANVVPEEQIKGINKQIKQLLLNANQIVTTQQNLFDEMRMDTRKTIEIVQNAQYCFKIDVKGHMPPVMLKFEYFNQQTNQLAHKNQISNLVDVQVSLSLKGPAMQKAKAPKSMKIQNHPGKNDIPFQDYIFITITTSEIPHPDLVLYLTASYKNAQASPQKQNARVQLDQQDKNNLTPAGGEEGQMLTNFDKKKKSQGLFQFQMETQKEINNMIQDPVQYKKFMDKLNDKIKTRKRQHEQQQQKQLQRHSQIQIESNQNLTMFEQPAQAAYMDCRSGTSQDNSRELSFKSPQNITFANNTFYSPNKNYTSYHSMMNTKVGQYDEQRVKQKERQQVATKNLERKEQIELESHKRKTFLVYRRNILKNIRQNQENINIDINKMRRKIIMWLKQIILHVAFVRVKHNFEHLVNRRNFKRLQRRCVKTIQRVYRNSMSRRAPKIQLRRKMEGRHFLTLVGLMEYHNKRDQAKKIVLDLLINSHALDKMVSSIREYNRIIVWIQKTYKTNQVAQYDRIEAIKDYWDNFLNKKIQEHMAIQKLGKKQNDKIQKIRAFQQEICIRADICDRYYFYMKHKLQLVDYKSKLDQAYMQYAIYSKILPAKAEVFEARVATYEGRLESILEIVEDAHKILGFSKPVKGGKKGKGKSKKKLSLVQRMKKLGINARPCFKDHDHAVFDQQMPDPDDDEDDVSKSDKMLDQERDITTAYIPDAETMQKLIDLGMSQFEKSRKANAEDDLAPGAGTGANVIL